MKKIQRKPFPARVQFIHLFSGLSKYKLKYASNFLLGQLSQTEFDSGPVGWPAKLT